MTKIEFGAEIKNIEDLQRLITGLIFRTSNFNLPSMVDLVASYLTISELKISKSKLTETIKESLDLFVRNGLVTYEDGEYTALLVFKTPLNKELLHKNNTTNNTKQRPRKSCSLIDKFNHNNYSC